MSIAGLGALGKNSRLGHLVTLLTRRDDRLGTLAMVSFTRTSAICATKA